MTTSFVRWITSLNTFVGGQAVFYVKHVSSLNPRRQASFVLAAFTGEVMKPENDPRDPRSCPTSFLPGSGPTHAPPSAAPVTDHMCLNVSVTEVVKSSNLAGRSFSVSTGSKGPLQQGRWLGAQSGGVQRRGNDFRAFAVDTGLPIGKNLLSPQL